MSNAGTKSLHQDIELLFSGESGEEHGDARLIELFLTGREEVRDRAFGLLVGRHGPMVLRICRQVLGDAHEADDAFQAVFLVLARCVAKVRRRDSLASWLYGVSLRVSAAARSRLLERRRKERPADELDLDSREPAGKAADDDRRKDDAEVVREELVRLRDAYREPIVLCYLEGLTHDQAAARLQCPVGTVRSRLARGRDQLRGRLARRGVTVPAVLGPLAAWLAGEAEAAGTAAFPAAIPVGLLSATVQTASRFSRGESMATAFLSTCSVNLAKEVLAAMTYRTLTLAALAVVPAASMVVGGAALVAQTQHGKGGARPTTLPDRPEVSSVALARQDVAPKTWTTPEAIPEQLAKARADYDEKVEAYREGRIAMEALLKGEGQLNGEEGMLGKEPRSAKAVRHLHRLEDVEAIAKGRFARARDGTVEKEQLVRDLAAVATELGYARRSVLLDRPFPEPRAEDLVEAARQRLDAQRVYYEEGRITIDRYVQASEGLMEAERLASRAEEGRRAAQARHVDRLKEIERVERARMEAGRGTVADFAEIVQNRVAAELRLRGSIAAPAADEPDIKALEARLQAVEKTLSEVLKQLAERPR
ncbi:ECF RNA polymerase sigma factor SigW [Aquisphaera giovannonii]|uniref:ECF RNA polymerase sigma factor SigW n=1 Tax=Aquisphaera giovannonii TaxID=406548 RepID=A0A5B9W9W5_9BACT|nr:RNA polymerase sigma factor [Aquisphaera giovannonii]QEH37227.1 ECF RNA polymerase sigma factor SigW [Aquisphaera giovannonii]